MPDPSRPAPRRPFPPRRGGPPKLPKLTHNKASGRARVRIRGKDVYLGRWGTPEAEEAYRRLCVDLLEGRDPSPATKSRDADDDGGPLTVAGLILAFKRWAEEQHVGPDGEPTGYLENLRLGLRLWRERYGLTPVEQFGGRQLAELREAMIAKGWARKNTIGKRVNMVRQVVRWGVSRDLVHPDVLARLTALEPLRPGRGGAKETEPVKPAPIADVEAVLPHLPSPIAAMVRVQFLTGMRPGEACGLTAAEIDRDGEVWEYRPRRHKNAHRGRDRRVQLGPRAQEVLAPFLDGRPAGKPLFSPAESYAESLARRREARVTPESCGNTPGSNRKANPKNQPGERYDTRTYAKAVRRACDKAGVARWSPNQLRHTHATEVRRRFGLDSARVALGHAGASVTEIYAERDADLARRVAAEVG